MILGVMLVFFGLLWLLAEAGILPNAPGVWQLWPLLVMALGFDLVLGRSPRRRTLAGLAAAALVLLGLFWLFMPNSERFSERELHIPLAAGISKAKISLRTQIANLDLSSSPTGDQNLLSGRFQLYRGEKLLTRKSSHGGVMFVYVASRIPQIRENRGSGPHWRVRLSRKPLYQMNVSLTVGNARLDLRGLQVETLGFESRVGNSTVYLPDHSGSFIINGGVGDLTVYLPPRVSVVLRVGKGVGSLEVRGLEEGDGSWRRGSGPALMLNISYIVGRVRVLPAP